MSNAQKCPLPSDVSGPIDAVQSDTGDVKMLATGAEVIYGKLGPVSDELGSDPAGRL
jgi:hypothetical protein